MKGRIEDRRVFGVLGQILEDLLAVDPVKRRLPGTDRLV